MDSRIYGVSQTLHNITSWYFLLPIIGLHHVVVVHLVCVSVSLREDEEFAGVDTLGDLLHAHWP